MTKQPGYSESDAMKAVDDALGQLDDNARHRILDWANSKFGTQGTLPSVPAAPQPRTPTPAVPTGDIKSFVAQKRPESFYERVACLAYYLEKSGGKNELKTRDISKANTDARLSNMSNPALFVKHATNTYGFLSRIGHGSFAISGRGEAIVEALPDRAKVKQALADHPFGKKSKKTKKSKS
jgi:hypothetical protein